MKEYIERANLMNGLTCSEMQAKIKSGTGAEAYSTVLTIVNCLAAADVVEVVRCKDCCFWEESEIAWGSEMACSCPELNISYGGDLYPGMDFFCKYGKRREENAKAD